MGDGRMRGAIRRRHAMPQLGWGNIACSRHTGRAKRCLKRHSPCILFRQPQGDARFDHLFDQQKDIGRAAARDRRHRIQQGFVSDRDVQAKGLCNGFGSLALLGAGMGVHKETRRRKPDQSRSVRHRPGNGDGAKELFKAGRGDSGGNAEQQFAGQWHGDTLCDLGNDLRLDRQDNRVATRKGFGGVFSDRNAVGLGKVVALRGIGVGDNDVQGAAPFETNPPMIAAAILPPPMNEMLVISQNRVITVAPTDWNLSMFIKASGASLRLI